MPADTLDLDAIEARLDRLAAASLTEPTDLETRALIARIRELEATIREADALTSAVRQAFSLDYVAPELLPERVAMAGAALQTARADYEEVEQARRDLHRVMHMQARDITEAANEITELRAKLDNERGEGAGPSEGWTYESGAWYRDHWTIWRDTDTDGPAEWVADLAGESMLHQPTAREAMRQADAARGAT